MLQLSVDTSIAHSRKILVRSVHIGYPDGHLRDRKRIGRQFRFGADLRSR
jgi:hypothetical protein